MRSNDYLRKKRKIMDIGLLSVLRTPIVDFHRGLANTYAKALKEAMDLHGRKDDKKQNYFLSAKRGFDDKLYVGNIHRIENHLYWNDEELADDDQIVNVVWVDGPITRDGGACSYGTKDMRDQVMYANTIPQVVGHLFYINTPGGESSARNDYEMLINDCREKGKPTVAFVDGLCASSGVNLASRCDRVIVMNPRDEFGCIGSMAAFWATPDGAIDRDGSRYVEIVGEDCPEKNAWWREAARGEYEKLQAEIDKSTREFHQSVRENRPLTEDWMLTGDMFEAMQLIPALVDEIGDYNRAIECVFQLADETLPAARFASPAPEDKPDGEAPEGREPEEMARLNAQQKAAVNTSRGDLMMAQDGHVTTEVQGFFGPETVEVATPKNDKEMPEDEKKVAEAAEQPVTTQEAPAQEAAAPVQEEQAPAAEAPAAAQGQEQEPAGQEPEKPAAEEEQEPAGQEPEKPGYPADLHFVEQGKLDEAQAELARVTDSLHTAETMIADKDAVIARLKESLATLTDIVGERDAAVQKCKDVSASLEKAGLDYAEQGRQLSDAQVRIAEHVATIEKLTKQVSELKAEVRELSGKETPMVDAAAGVPADNGTGEAPKYEGAVKSEINAGMTIDEIRAKLRAKDEKRKTYRH